MNAVKERCPSWIGFVSTVEAQGVRASDHIEQVSFLRRDFYYLDSHDHNQTEFWAWIALGILHRDSRSRVSTLNMATAIERALLEASVVCWIFCCGL